MLLTSIDPFVGEFDRLAQRVFGTTNGATGTRSVMRMDGIRRKDDVLLRFDLPGVDADSIDAEYTNGVLSVRLPLVAQAQPRKVEIRTDGKPEIAA